MFRMRTLPSIRDPFQSSMSILVDEFFNTLTLPETRDSLKAKSGFPRTNVTKTDEGFQIQMAVAGTQEGDVDIEIEDGLLTVSGGSQNVGEEEYILREIRKSSFRRSFQLPDDVNTDDITGGLKNGMLTIEIPQVVEEPEKKKVAISLS